VGVQWWGRSTGPAPCGASAWLRGYAPARGRRPGPFVHPALWTPPAARTPQYYSSTTALLRPLRSRFGRNHFGTRESRANRTAGMILGVCRTPIEIQCIMYPDRCRYDPSGPSLEPSPQPARNARSMHPYHLLLFHPIYPGPSSYVLSRDPWRTVHRNPASADGSNPRLRTSKWRPVVSNSLPLDDPSIPRSVDSRPPRQVGVAVRDGGVRDVE